MGMDLMANNSNQQYHMNWAGWRFFSNMLERLGQSTTEISDLNDGDIISQETCTQWATALELIVLNKNEEDFIRVCNEYNKLDLVKFLKESGGVQQL